MRKDVYYVSLLINWKLGTSSDISERDGGGHLLYVFICTAQVRPDDAEAPNHILIEGDNLEALTALSYTHTHEPYFCLAEK